MSISESHISELTRQRDALLAKVRMLSDLVNTIPGAIASARLDVREGKQTKLDYDRISRALNAPEF